ncbi:MAG TPA: prepilin-type N-terminal cleavage/methylation domain-containing protein [Chthoniobacteraceae bacterium]|jgi:prepilin-type N-terminal cleavage/methylation domain-containing protein|nr:prepilin-type N-terminal cleavage/methylation domain-containing protein [Chthoniobacteraceae bacterium]
MKKKNDLPRLPLSKIAARAFTLVELLAVIAVMVILMALSAPLVGSLRSAGNMNQSVLEVSMFIEQAQAYAMANNTYVWVGFREDATKPSVTIVAVAGTTGVVSDIDNASTRRVVNKPQEHYNLRLHDVTGLPGMAPADSVSTSDIKTFLHKVGASSVTFEKVIQFSPHGGARIKPTAISRWIQIGLQPMNGNTPNDKNMAALQIAGLTGQVRVFRP